MLDTDTELIAIELPLPPSANKAYASLRNRRILTAEGKLFKQQVRDLFGQAYATRPLPELQDHALALDITLTFEAVENAGWSKGTAKNRYKRVDVSNRLKLLEDAIFSALGVDDSLIFSLTVRKQAGTPASFVRIRLEERMT